MPECRGCKFFRERWAHHTPTSTSIRAAGLATRRVPDMQDDNGYDRGSERHVERLNVVQFRILSVVLRVTITDFTDARQSPPQK